MGLTDKQRKFAEEFRNGRNPTEAARKAGYSDPKSAAWRLKTLRSIQLYMEELDEAEPRRILNIVARGLDKIVDGDATEAPADRNRLIRALEVLGRNAGVRRKKAPEVKKEFKGFEIEFVDGDEGETEGE